MRRNTNVKRRCNDFSNQILSIRCNDQMHNDAITIIKRTYIYMYIDRHVNLLWKLRQKPIQPNLLLSWAAARLTLTLGWPQNETPTKTTKDNKGQHLDTEVVNVQVEVGFSLNVRRLAEVRESGTSATLKYQNLATQPIWMFGAWLKYESLALWPRWSTRV